MANLVAVLSLGSLFRDGKWGSGCSLATELIAQQKPPQLADLRSPSPTPLPKLSRKMVLALYDSFEYMSASRNIIWLGPTGCGKTGLATSFLSDEFISAFWDFIREGKYATHQQSQERPNFYRFEDPEHSAHPKRIELLTRNELALPDDARFTPIPAGEDLSSLSAILMDGSYYDYVLSSRTRRSPVILTERKDHIKRMADALLHRVANVVVMSQSVALISRMVT